VAQLDEHPTLDFGAGHDLSFVRSSPGSGSLLRIESARLPPSAPHPHHLSQINKIFKKKNSVICPLLCYSRTPNAMTLAECSNQKHFGTSDPNKGSLNMECLIDVCWIYCT